MSSVDVKNSSPRNSSLLPNSASSAALSGAAGTLNIGISSSASSPFLSTLSASPSSSPSSLLDPKRGANAVGNNVFKLWLYNRMFSRDRVERHYSFLIALLIASTVLFSLIKSQGHVFMWGAPICSFWASMLILVTLTNVWAEQRDKWGLFEFTRLVQFVLAMLSVLIYYDGSNVVNRYRFAQRGDSMLYDEVLLRMDEFLLGWLYPKGQMALYLDTQPDFGVTTQIGRVYAEIFQILYISYYFWGNAIGVYLAFNYFYFSVYKKIKGTRKRMQWRRIQMFVAAWVGSFVLNHLINLCFPAMSPRIYLKEDYKNELRGLWLLGGLRNAVTNAAANTYSAFPSGHCGLSILAAILSFRIGLHKAYSYLVLFTTVLIVLATQVLRYHYFVDFLFSLPIVAFGTWLGGFHEPEIYTRSLVEYGLEDHDEDGKPSFGGVPSASPVSSESIPLMSGVNGTSSDIEMGLTPSSGSSARSASPPLLSAQTFGMTRAVSFHAMNKIDENETSKAV